MRTSMLCPRLRVDVVALTLAGCLAVPTLASAQNTALVHGSGMLTRPGASGCNFYLEASPGMPQQSAEGAGECTSSGTYAGKPASATVATAASATRTGILQASVSVAASNDWADGSAAAGYNDWITIRLNEGATLPSEILLSAVLQGTHSNTLSGDGFARLETQIGGMFFSMLSMAPLGHSGDVLETATYRIPITASGVLRSGSTVMFGLDIRMHLAAGVTNAFSHLPQGSSSADFSAGSGAQRIWLVDASGNALDGQYSMTTWSGRDYDPALVPPITATPEPLTLALTTSGLLALLGIQGVRRRAASVA